MQSLGEAIQTAISTMTNSENSLTEPHICPHCEQEVPRMHLMICGVPKIVQPVCGCEARIYDQGISEAVEKKTMNEIERKFSISVLGERFEECRFKTFTLREGSENAAIMAQGYAKNFGDLGGESLLIYGEPGNGKSHLAAAVCHALKEKGKTPVFQSTPELLGRIRSTFNRNNKENESDIMTALLECDLLVLDDLGAEKVSDWVLDVMFRIIDGRYRQKKPTLFTTNYSPTELAQRFIPDKREREINKEDDIKARRLIDRIMEVSVVVENKARSFRMETAIKRAKTDNRRQWWDKEA